MYIFAPSVLAADFGRLREQIGAVDRAGAQYVHFDVMDGAFVPNISFGMPVIASLRGSTDRFFDVHMMVSEPGRYIREMRESGADGITVHAEACTHLDHTLRGIRDLGARAGVALNPATPFEMIREVLPLADMVLVMTVNPGFGGQKLIPYTLNKVRALRQYCDERDIPMDIQVDGGVYPENVRLFLDAGANVIVAGSAVFAGDAGENVRRFLEILKEYEER